MMPYDFPAFQRRLGYSFKDVNLLKHALSHRSFCVQHNERLEFMGDAIVDFCVAEILYHAFPDASEGLLSRYRAALVKKETLARISRQLQLGDVLLLGEGELKSGGFNRDSILANTLEALFAAVYFDSGWFAARDLVYQLFSPYLGEVEQVGEKDAKSTLQEWLQARRLSLPQYYIVSHKELSQGGHYFKMKCTLNEKPYESFGEGESRRIAEQNSALAMLKILKSEDK
jgi:ribonuclease-3